MNCSYIHVHIHVFILFNNYCYFRLHLSTEGVLKTPFVCSDTKLITCNMPLFCVFFTATPSTSGAAGQSSKTSSGKLAAESCDCMEYHVTVYRVSCDCTHVDAALPYQTTQHPSTSRSHDPDLSKHSTILLVRIEV